MAEGKTEILLIDCYVMVREGIRQILEKHLDFAVIGEAGRRQEALRIAEQKQPGIILLDPAMDGDGGYELIPALLRVAKSARVIILTGEPSPTDHRRAIDLGAMGLVLKQESSKALIRAIKKVSQGELWLERSMTARLVAEMLASARSKKDDPEASKIALVTRREREVIALAAKGLRNKQIAQALFIADSTVSHHLTSVFNKLGISDRLQLIVYAHQHGLADLRS
jgi:two-component system nitrate/nitrite response regulator NarL